MPQTSRSPECSKAPFPPSVATAGTARTMTGSSGTTAVRTGTGRRVAPTAIAASTASTAANALSSAHTVASTSAVRSTATTATTTAADNTYAVNHTSATATALRSSAAPPVAARTSIPNGDRRLEGWGIIDKITRFVHAVGRVSGGRGSAILVALPEQHERERTVTSASAQSLYSRRRGRRLQRLQRQHQGRAGTGVNTPLPCVPAAGDSLLHMDAQGESEGESRQPPLAVLLTTSAVLRSREDARGVTVTFLEQPVAGTAAQRGREPAPMTVAVRGDAAFVCSVAPAATSTVTADNDCMRRNSADGCGSTGHGSSFLHGGGHAVEAEEIGYTLTSCELEPRPCEEGVIGGGGGGSVTSTGSTASRGVSGGGFSDCSRTPPRASSPSSAIAEGFAGVGLHQHTRDGDLLVNPLPLPLLLSAMPTVSVGDTHLMVTHVDGCARHYVVQHVASVHRDFCVYADDATLLGDFCSGGPVFNLSGDFIGLQHRLGPQSICMLTTSIVRHLFAANKLGLCRSPISEQPPPDDGAFGPCVVTTMAHVPEEVFNQPFSFTQPSSATDVGVDGSRLVDFDDLERIRRHRERPRPLTERQPSVVEVYSEFYRGFGSLTHMLNAFYYCPALTAKVLETMVSPPHQRELQTVASSGGVGIVLEVMDGYPEREPLVATALSALSRMCLHRHNLVAFVCLDGVATVLEVLKEYPHAPHILQWGAYCLAHATQLTAPSVEETVDLLLRCSGVEMAAAALAAHGARNDHLTRWLCIALANMVRVRPRAVTLYVHDEVPQLILDLAAAHETDVDGGAGFVVAGLLALLGGILAPLRNELPDFTPFCSTEAAVSTAGDDGRSGPATAGGVRGAEALAALRAQLEQYENLKADVCVSPLSVSAYFVYTSLASQPVAAAVGVSLGRAPTGGDAPLSDDPNGQQLPVPHTPLNRLLLSVLDGASRERRNNASAELLAVCLDVLLVLDTWGLFPVYYSAAVDSADTSVLVGETSRHSGGGEPSAAPNESSAAPRLDARTVHDVLDRIRVHYAASPELMARLQQFAMDLD